MVNINVIGNTVHNILMAVIILSTSVTFLMAVDYILPVNLKTETFQDIITGLKI